MRSVNIHDTGRRSAHRVAALKGADCRRDLAGNGKAEAKKRRRVAEGIVMTNFRFSYLGAVALVLLPALLSGCGILRTGPGVDFDSTEVKVFRENQDKVLTELFRSAGLDKAKQLDAATPQPVKPQPVKPQPAKPEPAKPEPAKPEPVKPEPAKPEPATLNVDDWGKVINAGMDYADQRCEAYMTALVRLNRNKNTSISQIGLIGAATAGILAAASAAAKEIAATAILFGLGASTVENLSSNLLYEMEPSSVRTLVKGLQAGYRRVLPSPLNYNSRPGAVAVIRSYAALCTPANIEAEVNLAVKKAQPDAKKGDGNNGQPPTVSHNLSVASVDQIKDAERINLAVTALTKDTTKLAEINRVLKEVGASTADIADFQKAAAALGRAFRDMKSDETQKWLSALGL
jgi:hypothetical protein